MSLRYIAPKPRKGGGAQKSKTSKIALRLKKVCYKVFLYKNCQRQSCRAFIGLSKRARQEKKMDKGLERPVF